MCFLILFLHYIYIYFFFQVVEIIGGGGGANDMFAPPIVFMPDGGGGLPHSQDRRLCLRTRWTLRKTNLNRKDDENERENLCYMGPLIPNPFSPAHLLNQVR